MPDSSLDTPAPATAFWRDGQTRRYLATAGVLLLLNVSQTFVNQILSIRMRDGLTRAKAGDPDRPVVIFCRSDCWMSWNAARRAVEWGFDPVIWFPGGTDAWEQAGQPLVTVEPVAP